MSQPPKLVTHFLGVESSILITGPERTGKTSIAFSLAREIAEHREDSQVWFICQRGKIQAALPANVSTSPSSNRNFQGWAEASEMGRLQMKYFSSLSDIKWWCQRVQELPAQLLPSAIFVDDLDLFLAAEIASSPDLAARTLLHFFALLHHAADFLAQLRGEPCPLIVCFSETSSLYSEVRCVLDRGAKCNHHSIQKTGTPDCYTFRDQRRGTEVGFVWRSIGPGTEADFVFEIGLSGVS